MKNNFITALVLIFVCAGCVPGRIAKQPHEPVLEYLDQYIIPPAFQFRGTTVGGLSSIDFDPATNQYYFISDDRSSINPARFYKAHIEIINNGIQSIQFNAVDSFRKPDGSVFPPESSHHHQAPDPEALRYHAGNNWVIWSSEGERLVKENHLMDPAIYISDSTGKVLDSLLLPANFKMQPTTSGPRRNGTLEGLALNQRQDMLLASMEEPLCQDGSRAGLNDSTAWIRILKFDLATRQPVFQYAYQIDAVVQTPEPLTAFRVNGVSEILDIGHDRLLVVERSWSTGMKPSAVRIYLADLSGAEDISQIPSLVNKNFRPAKKKLLFNLDDLPIHIGNIEGITLGPLLPNGKRSLLLVADDNFVNDQVSQVLLFQFEDPMHAGK